MNTTHNTSTNELAQQLVAKYRKELEDMDNVLRHEAVYLNTINKEYMISRAENAMYEEEKPGGVLKRPW